MKAPITSAQAMSHPTVVETINTLGEIAAELRAELATARADEREACAKVAEDMNRAILAMLNFTSQPEALAAAIRARGQRTPEGGTP
jgi:hypothetical protein